MNTIGDLLTRPLDRKIEEIIQVDQADEPSVYAEITEYIATDSIREQYLHTLRAIAEAPAEPHEGVGVWVSGFFGSGKSSFAKNLGYALQNRKVLGEDFATLFKQQFDDAQIGNLLDSINSRIPTEVILFEVAKERDTRKVTERIAELMYTVLLRQLDYAEDFDIAELEIELEAEGKLDAFIDTCQKLHHLDWRRVRKGAQKISRASAIMHQIDQVTYPSAETWSHDQRNRDAAITVSRVVERTFELAGRRRPGKAIVFIIDEVGQHVARSGDKIEDLRATVEEFGKVGKNLLQAREIVAPCWIVVTSQEKLDEVVAAIDSHRVDIAKLQDRFRYRVDLAPSDIREVATRRVLAKKTEAEPLLKKLFHDNQGALNAALRLERTSRRSEISKDDFVQFYPYPPHYIDLCIGIMSGIRLQPGAPRHYGGSNRTIIKQTYEMLVSERTDMAHQPIGTLVTLDKVFELVEGNLSNERRTDIYNIGQQFKDDPDDHGWALRVAKVICLLEYIRDLPRTEANLAAFLVDVVGQPPQLSEVEAAVERLRKAQFIRNTEDGWKLQTAQEKTWETERRSHLEPRPRDRNDITRRVLRDIFSEAAFRTYRYKDHRSFRVGVMVDGATIGDEGDLPVALSVADDTEDLAKQLEDIRDESRQHNHANDVYWVFALTPEIDDLVAQLYASNRMVEKYDQLRAQNKITGDEAVCLQDEKSAVLGYQTRLRDKFTEAMENGTGLFRGVSWDASSLGKQLSEIYRKLFANVVPLLYPKLEMGSRPLKGDEAELILKAADLKALPQVFYAGDNGLGLVVQEGAKQVLNPSAAVAQEVFGYLESEHSYGNKDTRTGRALERRFGGIGYGWERDMIRLILALLFRSGSIDVTYQGNLHRNYQDPLSRVPFANNVAFRSSLFSPRQSTDIKTLTLAVQQLEDLTGEEVDVEEGAIATAFQRLASEELEKLHPVVATAQAHQLPVLSLLTDFQHTLVGIQSSTSDDCVRILTETGDLFHDSRERIHKIRTALSDDKTLRLIKQARTVVHEVWPKLASRPLADTEKQNYEDLCKLLESEQSFDHLDDIASHTTSLMKVYCDTYLDLFDQRRTAFDQAIEELKGRTEWQAVSPEVADRLLISLRSRLGDETDRQSVAAGESLGSATLAEMESDLAAVDALQATAIAQLQEETIDKAPETVIRRLRITEVFDRPIQSQADLNAALEQLRDTLQKLIDEGAAIILE